MILQRLFTSADMNPANVTTPATVFGPGTAAFGPSGVPGGTVAPALPFGTVQFPAVSAGGGLLVKNDGFTTLVLFYDDTQPSGNAAWVSLLKTNPSNGTGGTVQIAPGKFTILTNTNAGPIATYAGGPFSLFAGTFQYAVVLDPADHPNATVLA